jgi:uncharacterized protein YoaH (UPF0181 family)
MRPKEPQKEQLIWQKKKPMRNGLPQYGEALQFVPDALREQVKKEAGI